MNKQEVKRETAITHNLKMMNAQMLEHLLSESMGGNAGDVQTSSGLFYICGTANGYIGKDGKIAMFANVQHVPEAIKSTSKAFSLNVAFSPDWTVHKIIEVEDKNHMDEELMGILEESADRFNKEHEKPSA